MMRSSPCMDWEVEMTKIEGEFNALVNSGKWNVGNEDLLSIIGRGRYELFHSSILAWMLNPSEKHGLGTLFLESVLRSCGIEDFGDLRFARAETEIQHSETRADIVVFCDQITLIIENKIYAGEQPEQCKRLEKRFSHHPRAVFVFLTPDGRRPLTVENSAESIWKSISYSKIAMLIEVALTSANKQEGGPALSTVRNYLKTLERIMDISSNERIAFYLKHQKNIEEWSCVSSEARDAVNHILWSCQKGIHEAVESLKDGIEFRPYLFNPAEQNPKKRRRGGNACETVEHEDSRLFQKMFLFKPQWRDKSSVFPKAAIGLEWKSNSVSFADDRFKPCVGVWIAYKHPKYSEFGDRLKKALDEVPQPSGFKIEKGNNKWWMIYTLMTPEGNYWEDPSSFQEKVVDSIQSFWKIYSPCINEVLNSGG